MNLQERKYHRVVFLWLLLGLIFWWFIGKLAVDFPPGWKDILQGSFGFVWLIGGGIFVSKKWKKLQRDRVDATNKNRKDIQ